MRLWHYSLLPYLPDKQFKGQLRELKLIMKDLETKGKTNHLLINKVMDYPAEELNVYAALYSAEYFHRYGKSCKLSIKPYDFIYKKGCFPNWHDKDYLRVCMANLFEKWYYGRGNSRITDAEFLVLLDGYKEITGEEYKI